MLREFLDVRDNVLLENRGDRLRLFSQHEGCHRIGVTLVAVLPPGDYQNEDNGRTLGEPSDAADTAVGDSYAPGKLSNKGFR